MRILYFEVEDLLNRAGTVSAYLKEDLNILTGRNGAGKTTLLKLLWYVVSGNILLALREVAFSRVTVRTDLYEITVHKLGPVTCRVEFTRGEKKLVFEDEQDYDGDVVRNAEDSANSILVETGSSLFFPTFRRIEGGFSLSRNSRSSLVPGTLEMIGRTRSKAGEIEEGMATLSKRLSNNSHVFIAGISTVDVVSLLLAQFADLSDRSTILQQNVSTEVIATIREFRSDAENAQQIDQAKQLLDEVRAKIEDVEKQRGDIMTPFNAVRDLVQKQFEHKGISIGTRLSFGDAATAVNSDALSAGEKQMLSFICYNAFNSNGVVMIDEPELSLHPDWQRQLFPILLGQGSSNQFIIATHSPFIYGRYPDKEIALVSDRGDDAELVVK